MLTLRHAEPGSQAGLRADCADAAELILPAVPESAEAARQFAGSTLGVWGVPDTGNVVLVISELAANAVNAEPRGSQAEILLRLSLAVSYVIVQVGDGNPAAPPRPGRRARAKAESGRGLPIARELSATLSWYSDGRWKIVWAAVPRSDAPSRRDTWTRWDTWTRRRLGRAA
jgi:anti-sigma regulatory factor (Ser/Thr protein kinase)